MAKSIDRYISFRSTNYMRNQCKPLYSFGIIGFHHDISFPKGELSMLTTQKSVFEHWFENRIPPFCTDENGRILKSGVYLDSYLEDTYQDYNEKKQQFLSQFNANQLVNIVERDSDCQHLYTFVFSPKQDKEFLHWVVNNINRLHNFLEYYKLASADLINEVKDPANRIVLPLEKNNDNALQEKTDLVTQYIIHKESKIKIHLSKQQSICLVLLMQGKTAKEIAGLMNLSYRTVQHYADRIRKILGCVSLKELIIAYGDQVISEKWNPIRKLFE